MHAALKAFAAVYTSVRLEHRNTTELETHTQRARVIEGEIERERPIGLCLSLYRVDLLASCNELSACMLLLLPSTKRETVYDPRCD